MQRIANSILATAPFVWIVQTNPFARQEFRCIEFLYRLELSIRRLTTTQLKEASDEKYNAADLDGAARALVIAAHHRCGSPRCPRPAQRSRRRHQRRLRLHQSQHEQRRAGHDRQFVHRPRHQRNILARLSLHSSKSTTPATPWTPTTSPSCPTFHSSPPHAPSEGVPKRN